MSLFLFFKNHNLHRYVINFHLFLIYIYLKFYNKKKKKWILPMEVQLFFECICKFLFTFKNYIYVLLTCNNLTISY